MKWKNVFSDGLPDHGKTVVICVDGVYYLAHYDSRRKHFKLKEENSTLSTSYSRHLYWLEIENT